MKDKGQEASRNGDNKAREMPQLEGNLATPPQRQIDLTIKLYF